jgi:hypothetical protein
MSDPKGPEDERKHYVHLALMTALMFSAMYALMYAMVRGRQSEIAQMKAILAR